MTSAAVRSLERARRLRGKSLLEQSRSKLIQIVHTNELPVGDAAVEQTAVVPQPRLSVVDLPPEPQENTGRRKRRSKDGADRFSNRKPITEVLHDIYDDAAR